MYTGQITIRIKKSHFIFQMNIVNMHSQKPLTFAV